MLPFSLIDHVRGFPRVRQFFVVSQFCRGTAYFLYSAVVDNGSDKLMTGREIGSVSHGMTMKGTTDMREQGLSTSWSKILLLWA